MSTIVAGRHCAKRILSPRAGVYLQRNFTSAVPLHSVVDSSTVPRVASSSLWHSIIPKAFRHPDDPVSMAERKRAKSSANKDWNPATFFIVIAILIGSNAIQMIALKNERRNFNRKADAKIALLKETIDRIRKGEDVDVERVLGTGDPEKEAEWEEVMKEIEHGGPLGQAQNEKSEDVDTPAPEAPIAKAKTAEKAEIPTRRQPGFY